MSKYSPKGISTCRRAMHPTAPSSFMQAAIVDAEYWRWSARTGAFSSGWSRAKVSCKSPRGGRSNKDVIQVHKPSAGRYPTGQVTHPGPDGDTNEKSDIDRIVVCRSGAARRLPQKEQCE